MLAALLSLLTPLNIFLVVCGVIVGILFGAIPGLSSTMAIALFLPITFAFHVESAFVLLVALYIGGVSGGLISAILINIPGSAMSIATTYDGSPMAKNGQAHRALGIGIVFSFLGTMFGLIILILAAPPLSMLTIKLSSYDFFALTLLSLTLISGVSGKNMMLGLVSGFMGLAIAMVGIAPIDGTPRFTFGNIQLLNGFSLLPGVIGLFAVTEIMKSVSEMHKKPVVKAETEKVRGFGFSFMEMVGQTKNFLISSVIGLIIGFLPGMGGSLANQVAYAAVQKNSKHPEKFGTGIMDGIVASESSNNASIGGAMIPLLTLGIPGDGPTAMLLGAFMIHGVVPGPLLFTTSKPLINLIFLSLVVSSVVMLFIEYYGLRLFVKALNVPKEILLPSILVLCTVGSFATNNNMFDVWTLLIFGVFGFLMHKMKIPRAPMVLGFVLGPAVETYLRRAIQHSRGSLLPFVTHPVSAILLAGSLVIIVFSFIGQFKAVKEEKLKAAEAGK